MGKQQGLLRPEELRRITSEKDMEEAKKAMALREKAQDQAKQLYKAFMEEELDPDVAQARVSAAVRGAAEKGKSEVLMLEIDSEWCTDRGRAINNTEPDWPQTLTGFAKRAFDYFETALRPLGYRLRAEVLDFPGGMPGKIGLYLAW